MLFGIYLTFSTFTIQNNYRHFIFTDWIREEGEWFLWWGSFQLLIRSQYTTQQFHTTQHCGCDNLFWNVQGNICSLSTSLLPNLRSTNSLLKEKFWTCIKKTNVHCILLLSQLILHNLSFTSSCEVIFIFVTLICHIHGNFLLENKSEPSL